MNHQRLRVTDVGEVAGQVHRFDEGATGIAATLHAEAEYGSRALRQVFQAALVVRVVRKPCPVHILDAWVAFQPFGDGARVVDVRLHAERERLDTLRKQECGVRGEGRPDVTQLFGPKAREERELAEVARPLESAVTRHRLVEQRELVAVPGEATTLDDHAAEGGAVPAEKLRGRVDGDICSPFERPVQVRRRDGRVDDQRDAGGVGHLGETLDVRHLTGRVRDDLGENELRIVGDGCRVVGRVCALHKRRFDAETAEGDIQLGDRTSIQARARDDVITGSGQAGEGDELRGEAAGGGDGAESAFEACNAFLEGCDGGIAHARVNVAVLLQREASGGIRSVVEHERTGLVNGQRPCAGYSVGDVARVNRTRREAVFAICHGPTLARLAERGVVACNGAQ